MSRVRLTRIALGLAALAAVAAAVIAANFALLAYAQPSNDPVGSLSPRVEATAPPPVVPTTLAPDDDDESGPDADD